jgi:hypothetical protein
MVAEAIGSIGARGLLLVCLVGLCGTLLAEEETPYRVAVPVADQGPESRRAAEREALATVFVRVTGRESVLSRGALRAALRQPQRFYTSSGYERRDPRERLADAEDRPWRLVIDFDPRPITDLLAAEEIPVWTTRRPEVLFWVLEEDESGQRRLAGAEDPSGAALLARAGRRGLEVFLPVLDLTELASFPMGDAWAGYGNVIARASRRYGSASYVSVRLYPDPLGRWIADWDGEILGERITGAREVDGPVPGAEVMLDAVADALAERFAIRLDTGSGGSSLWLQVDRVDGLAAYAGLLRYLEGTDGVADVQLVQMQDASLLLRVDTADAVDRLLDLLRLEGRLVPATAPAHSGGIAVWRARWTSGAGR